MDAPFVFKASDKRQEAVDTEDACTAASEEVRDAAEVCRVQHKKTTGRKQGILHTPRTIFQVCVFILIYLFPWAVQAFWGVFFQSALLRQNKQNVFLAELTIGYQFAPLLQEYAARSRSRQIVGFGGGGD